MGLVKAVSCGLLGSKGKVEAIICVLVEVNLCGLEEAVWLWGNIRLFHNDQECRDNSKSI